MDLSCVNIVILCFTCTRDVLYQALLWMFNDSRSFYFATDFDLTQSLQRNAMSCGSNTDLEDHVPLWQRGEHVCV